MKFPKDMGRFFTVATEDRDCIQSVTHGRQCFQGQGWRKPCSVEIKIGNMWNKFLTLWKVPWEF